MKLLLNSDLFEYDIRGLLMAFFPWEKFDTEEDGTAEGESCLKIRFTGIGQDEKSAEDALIVFSHEKKQYFRGVRLDPKDRKQSKTALKRALYETLAEAAGHGLPWGTLTGIRPTKIPMAMINEGKSEPEIRAHMQGELLCSEEKTGLSIDIARRELRVLRPVTEETGYSLYIGIPFCPTTCLYCSFTSYQIGKYIKKVDEYLAAVHQEIIYISEKFKDVPLHSIYFGGGTPTSIDAEKLDILCRDVVTHFDLSHVAEWTVEAGRPDSVTREKLEVLKKYPVTRISINPQTMHDKTLKLIGRNHTVDDVKRVFAMARELGFDNINTDLILGLPGETEADMQETIREICGMRPDNVTIHSLAIKRSSRLNQEKAFYSAYRMENTDEMMAYCREALRAIGLHPYYLYRQKNMAGNQENVGYAREGKEGLYNILIMEEIETIVAIGAGATTKRVQGDLITRAENVKNVDIYIENIAEMIRRKEELFR